MNDLKIIFLDFDGVLNSKQFFEKCSNEMLTPDNHIDKDSVQVLNKIIELTNAKVVVSSSWRLAQTPANLEFLLKKFGFIGKVIDKTPDLFDKGLDRGDEILSWITKCEANLNIKINYIVIDDIDVWACKDRQIKTEFNTGGLNHIHIQQAVNLFAKS